MKKAMIYAAAMLAISCNSVAVRGGNDYSVDVRNATPERIEATISYGDYSFGNHLLPGQSKVDVSVFDPVPDVAEVSWVANDGAMYRVSVRVRERLPKEFKKNHHAIIFTIQPEGKVKLTFDVGDGYQTREVDGIDGQ
jgi:hypothetical protein